MGRIDNIASGSFNFIPRQSNFSLYVEDARVVLISIKRMSTSAVLPSN